MPLYDFKCISGHVTEIFVYHVDNRGCDTVICHCGHSMGQVISPGNRMLYFEEGRGHLMWNLGPEPVMIHSHRELEKKMKERGLDFAGSKPGTKGSWI